MPQFTIIRDSGEINKRLNRQGKIGAEYYELLHGNAIMVLVHANEHGSIAPINRFYGMLTDNDKRAFRNYVHAFQTTKIDGKVVKTERAFLAFKDNEFRIDTNTPVEQRRPGSPFIKYVEDVLLNPDGKTSKPFYERNNLVDQVTLFDDTNIIEAIKRLVKQAKADDTDTRKVLVSEPMLQFMKDVEKKANELAVRLDVASLHESNVVQLRQPAAVETPVEPAVEEDTRPRRKRAASAA